MTTFPEFSRYRILRRVCASPSFWGHSGTVSLDSRSAVTAVVASRHQGLCDLQSGITWAFFFFFLQPRGTACSYSACDLHTFQDTGSLPEPYKTLEGKWVGFLGRPLPEEQPPWSGKGWAVERVSKNGRARKPGWSVASQGLALASSPGGLREPREKSSSCWSCFTWVSKEASLCLSFI